MKILQPNEQNVHIIRTHSTHPLRSLLIYAAACEFFYLLLVALSPLPGFHLTSTPIVDAFPWTLFISRVLIQDTGQLLIHYSWISFALLGFTLLGLCGTYVGTLFYRLRQQRTQSTTKAGSPPRNEHIYLYIILASAALFGITLLFQPMLLSDDVFVYMFSGRILAIYHANPFNTVPQQFSADPYLFWTITGRQTPNIYGPLWIYISAALASLSNNPLISLFLFKGLAVCVHLLNSLLVWTILGHIAPTRRVIGTLVYAWSPLALIELVASGHSEGLLITLLLTATLCFVLLLERQKQASQGNNLFARPMFWRLSMLIVLGLATGINMVTLLIAPLYVWFELRQHRITQALSGSIWRLVSILMIGFLLLLPLWRGSETFFSITSSVDMAHFVHSPVALFTLPIHAIYQQAFSFLQGSISLTLVPDSAADTTIRATAMLIFLIIYANLFSQIRRAPRTPIGVRNRRNADIEMLIPGFDVLITSCCLAIFWYLILVSGWFWPWYILWVLWLAALRRIDALTSALLLLSCTALFIYAFTGFTKNPLETYQSAIIFGIPILYLWIIKKKQKQTERILTSDVRRD